MFNSEILFREYVIVFHFYKSTESYNQKFDIIYVALRVLRKK